MIKKELLKYLENLIKYKIIKINNFIFQKLRRMKSLHFRVFAKILLIFLPKGFYKVENEIDIKKKLTSKTIFIFGWYSALACLVISGLDAPTVAAKDLRHHLGQRKR